MLAWLTFSAPAEFKNCTPFIRETLVFSFVLFLSFFGDGAREAKKMKSIFNVYGRAGAEAPSQGRDNIKQVNI